MHSLPVSAGDFDQLETFMKNPFIFLPVLFAYILVLPAHAGSFSFNKASAEKMVAACREEGVELSHEQACAIVEARESLHFLKPDDLAGILTEDKIFELDPIEEENDLVFNPNAMPGMKSY